MPRRSPVRSVRCHGAAERPVGRRTTLSRGHRFRGSVRLPSGTERNKQLWWLACAVSLAALLAHLPSVANLYTYDDRWIISENPLITGSHRWSDYLNTPYWPTPRNSLYRPLVLVAYRVEWVLGGGSPAIFHVLNVALYAGICALLAVAL